MGCICKIVSCWDWHTLSLPEYYGPGQDSEFYACDERPNYSVGSRIMAQNAAIGVVEKGATPGAFGTLP